MRHTLEQVIDNAIETRLVDVHTAMPGKVEKYDADTQLADVKPLLKRVIVDENRNEIIESLPVITNVPLCFPRANDFFISFPVKKGDLVLLVFAERSIDQWFDKGDEQDPVDLSKHPLHGAIAIPGVYNKDQKLDDVHAENIVIGKNGGCQAHFKSDMICLGEENPSSFVALATAVKDNLDRIKGDIQSVLTHSNTHTHVCAAPGSPSGVAVPPLAGVPSNPTDTAASEVKAK
jgi:hypothetical protein